MGVLLKNVPSCPAVFWRFKRCCLISLLCVSNASVTSSNSALYCACKSASLSMADRVCSASLVDRTFCYRKTNLIKTFWMWLWKIYMYWFWSCLTVFSRVVACFLWSSICLINDELDRSLSLSKFLCFSSSSVYNKN